MPEMITPHNYIIRQGSPPLDDWKCRYCDYQGTYDELEVVACTYEYPPCSYCGETPTCTPECVGGVVMSLKKSFMILNLQVIIRRLTDNV